MHTRPALVSVLLLLFGCVSPVSARQSDDVYRLEAQRAVTPIAIDGALDEAAWRLAPVASGFIQNEPHEGEAASEPTDVKILYDETNLYIGVYAHDSAPDDIIVNDLRKDFDTSSTDVFQVVLDTFHDGRNGYVFAVNAMGAKWDAQMVNEGRDLNTNWDGIWSVRTRIGSEGWYAEIAIPFRTLRFSDANVQTWGINFMRRIRRRNEDSFWAPIPRIYQLYRVSLAGTLDGLRGVRPGKDLRVKPYVLTSGHDVAANPVVGDFQGGVDAKYGVTSSLTWDFTVNTDFSQVEADEQQVNLTRFNLLFPEKRDFFLENSGVFQFGPAPNTSGSSASSGRTNQLGENILFFSRRIGLSDNGVAIPILAGTRLTGRAGGFTIGAVNIQQRSAAAVPSTNFTAVRIRRNVFANSDVGVLVLNKEPAGDGYNRLVGADANFRFFNNLNVYGLVARSLSPVLVTGVAGNDLTSRAGFQYRNDRIETRLSYTLTGSRFNDELGFIPRVGIGRTDAYMGPHFRPQRISRWIREIFPHYQLINVTRADDGAFDSRYSDYHLPFAFQNGGLLETGMNANTEVLTRPFVINRARNITIDPGRYDYNDYFMTIRTNSSARISVTSRYGLGEFYDGYKHAYLVGTTVRMSAAFNVGATVQRNTISLPDGAYTTDLVTGRLNYSFSTRMFLNALIQYNTDAHEWSSNIRFNIIHRPLSDVFVVYNDRRDSGSASLLDRALIAKVTYLMAF